MYRPFLKFTLVLGIIFGLAAGFSHLRHGAWGHHGWGPGAHGHTAHGSWEEHPRFEQHIAEICVEAALSAAAKKDAPTTRPGGGI